MKKFRWNGIPIKKGKNIEDRVNYYCILLLCLSLSLGICMLFPIRVFMNNYNKVIDSIYCLQEMWDDLKNMQDTAIEYVLRGTSKEKSAYQISQKNVSLYCQELDKLNIGGNFHRNLSDLNILIGHYDQQLELIMEASASSQNLEKTGEFNSVSPPSDIYTAVRNRYQIITGEVQEYFQQQREVMNRQLQILIYLLIAFFVTGLFLIWQNTTILTKEIVVPLKWLTHKTKTAWERSEGNSHSFLETEWEMPGQPLEEIQILHDSTQEMMQRIQEQIAQLKESMAVKEQLKEQELENLRITNLLTLSELHCLQMQINPHFLFNTLNMIQQTIYLDQKEKTSQLLKETAAFLRYSLDYIGKDVTLYQELEALGNYINLQEERLGDRILFEFILDERLNQWYVPCLILQPLVENSIIHGMSQKRPGALITIRTVFDDESGNGYIYVSDNGQGMTQAKLEALKKELFTDSQKAAERIGLHNIARRLSLFKKGHEELKIDSQENLGTTITIVLYNQAKESFDENFNCR